MQVFGRYFFGLLVLAAGCASWARAVPVANDSVTNAGFFSGRYKVQCEKGVQGCACSQGAEANSTVAARFRHATVVSAADAAAEPSTDVVTRIRLDANSTCVYPTADLRPIRWQNANCPDPEAERSVPFPSIADILAEGSSEGERRPVGKIFPTFYNIADESFHEGDGVEILKESGTGRTIAQVSKSFRDDLDMQGTGRLRDGRVLNVAEWINKVWNYRILPSGEYGHGILGHRIHPLRSVAVDFQHLCDQTGQSFCGLPLADIRKRMVGALLYIPRLKGAVLANGSVHDGFVCAQDIGGAIKGDRIDLFVGPTGAGNPYLPDCRQRNAFSDHGIESINPSDWPTVVRSGTDSDGRPAYRRVVQNEYRTASPGKALEIFLVQGARCRP